MNKECFDNCLDNYLNKDNKEKIFIQNNKMPQTQTIKNWELSENKYTIDELEKNMEMNNTFRVDPNQASFPIVY